MKEQLFFICKHCGNLITFIEDKGLPVVCCGENMKKLVANTSDGAKEKHVPVVEIDGNKAVVKIGSIAHPMLPEHHIAWVYLKTNSGGHIRYLETGAEPAACFRLCDQEKAEIAYEYCNLHGLWKAEIE